MAHTADIHEQQENSPSNAWDRFDRPAKLALIDTGLPQTGRRCKSVIVVGAGMAGLTAAYELKRAGHTVTVLEAQQRTGGRIWTLREPFSDGLFGEAGAMRLPTPHKLIRAYIHRAGLDADLAEFTMSCDNAHYDFNHRNVRVAEYRAAPQRLGFDTPRMLQDGGRLIRPGLRDPQNQMTLPCEEDAEQVVAGPLWRHRAAEERWQDVMRGLRAEFCDADGVPDWERLSRSYDHISTFQFLELGGATNTLDNEDGTARSSTTRPLFDPFTYNEIHEYGLIENQQARLSNSVLALLRECVESPLDGSAQFHYLQNGMDQIPLWFQRQLREEIRFGANVEAIDQEPDGRVVVRYRTAAQTDALVRADHLVITLPFTILRHVEGAHRFSSRKCRAIQALNYSAAGKIFVQCRRRFWEEGAYPIVGGRSQTDMALRSVWYPQHGRETGRGVLMASYTWGSDAQRWEHLSEEKRLRKAIEGLDKLHVGPDGQPFILRDNIVEVGVSVMWQDQPFAGGAFALFNPRQERLHREAMRRMEGLDDGPKRIHFAGEHTSPEYHRWIEGAVDSGLRAAWEVNAACA